ncbi:SDR family NAD(P)-dependent oxidoreductase [Muricoccus roseus]|nr:3-oxoacyl-ACP reductase FabG [Roseomonas rosea]
MSKPLEGQVAVVTGGARGIGLATAQRLARDGARVAIWDRDPGLLDSAAFRPALLARVDVTDLASVQAVVAETEAALGRVDILVNNAGITGPVHPLWEYPPEAWHQVLAVNLTGVFHCCRAVLPGMRERRHGRIISVSSLSGKEGTPEIGAYAAAKAGVIGLTKSMARELAGSGVLVNSVAPAMAETELLQALTPDFIAAAKGRIPMGRFAGIAEIAAMIAWIAGPDCSFTTGFTFDISGGRATY